MGAAGLCTACGLALREGARFCDGCGAAVAASSEQAEYKQVTVLFADVVRSMEIASALGAERLREIMTEVLQCCTTVVRRYGGTVDKFTGDGVMALFGAPAALEDHALRACLAALDVHVEATRLADEVESRDGIMLRLRVGLNSGQVIAGEIGSGPMGYTAIGEQVGMAQRMEAVAPPGGVMLSESTARLVEHSTVLGEPELVRIKGANDPVPARRLLAVAAERSQNSRREPTLVGRAWQMNTVAGILDQSISGAGCVAGVVGPPGIGKSRIVGELSKLAADRGVEVFSTFCESHTRDVPFHVAARLLRTTFGVSELESPAARARVRARIPHADPDDMLLLDDLLGIRDPDVDPPTISPDARRRRVTALVNSAALARTTPAVYVIEDAHWIDEVSESMLAEFLTVVPQRAALALITYRPEYRGALSRTPGAHTIALAPLNVGQTAALTAELLGPHPSVTAVAAKIAKRAAGNPFFAEAMVRDLADRGVLVGDRGSYVCHDDADVSVPGSLQATIAARTDRLSAAAKHALYSAAVIGLRFRPDLLTVVMGDAAPEAAITELLDAELVDQVMFTPRAEYAFRHPLIQTVAYESQLKAGRAELHRRLAAEIERGDPGSADDNAALIAEHLEAAGDLQSAFGWHMRAGTWSTNRDLAAARMSWQRARQVADRLPADDPNRTTMQIAPRSLLCGTTWRAASGLVDTGFDEFRELCAVADDKVSLAVGMAGTVAALTMFNDHREASRLASELTELVESIGDQKLTVALLFSASFAKAWAGEMTESLRLSQRIIDLADGDPTKGDLLIGSPLAFALTMRGMARLCLGLGGWRDDLDMAIATAAPVDPTSHVVVLMYKYTFPIPIGALPADATALRDTADALAIAEQCGDDFALGVARVCRGMALVRNAGPDRKEGLALLALVREDAANGQFMTLVLPIADPVLIEERARSGDLDGAIEAASTLVDYEFDTGAFIWRGLSTTVLVESLLHRGTDDDRETAQAAIDRLAAAATEPVFVPHEIALVRLRALVARAHGDDAAYGDLMERYRTKATAAGFAAPSGTSPLGPSL
ncbi:MAG: hypothetical protein QOH54_1895 [Mycobacterium sp.]|jgi:adenylate cyclase|nr:hypothetical protein [Mycobacterium sp.]MDT5126251.1 hypothetical protein [Mycobacterium sp.]